MHVLTQNGARFRVFQDSRQGGRMYMEDVACMNTYKSENGEHDFIYLAIFDGHGGPQAAEFAKEHLLEELKNAKGFWTHDKEQIAKAIREAFVSTHKLMWKDVVSWPKTVSGLPSTAGTTASVVLIKAGYMYIAHVGDSSIVLAEKKSWRNLHANCVTVDHKPDSPKELKRIEASGGQVQLKAGVPRVVWYRPKPPHKGPVRRSTHMVAVPFLAVARALGDLWSYNSEQDTFIVSPEPDISVYKVDYKKHKYIIIASDGLWNMVKPQEAVTYVEELSMEMFDESKNNPAKKLVQCALNRWAYKNLRADNTSVILVTVDQESENDQKLSRSNSNVSSASTIKLTDADVFTDLDVNVRGNVKVVADENNIGRPGFSHGGFCQHFPKRPSSTGGRHTRRIIHCIHTPDSAQMRCFPERWRRLHKNNHSRKFRSHLFWDEPSLAMSRDKIIIPTKYKSVEWTTGATVTHDQPKPDSTSVSQLKQKESQVAEKSEVASDLVCHVHDQTAGTDPGETPDEISVAVPQEELPELNKIIIPSKYKVVDIKHGTDVIKSCPMSDGEEQSLTRLSTLQECDGTVNKRKASTIDAAMVTVKKPKRSIANAQNTEPLTVISESATASLALTKSGCDDTAHLEGAKLSSSARPPLTVNTYHDELPSTAVISPIWPDLLESDVPQSSGNSLCTTYPLSGKQNCCSLIHKSFPGTAPNGLHFQKKSSSAKSQEVRGTAKRLYFRNRRIKLGNIRHRTRLHVRTRFTRKY